MLHLYSYEAYSCADRSTIFAERLFYMTKSIFNLVFILDGDSVGLHSTLAILHYCNDNKLRVSLSRQV